MLGTVTVLPPPEEVGFGQSAALSAGGAEDCDSGSGGAVRGMPVSSSSAFSTSDAARLRIEDFRLMNAGSRGSTSVDSSKCWSVPCSTAASFLSDSELTNSSEDWMGLHDLV